MSRKTAVPALAAAIVLVVAAASGGVVVGQFAGATDAAAQVDGTETGEDGNETGVEGTETVEGNATGTAEDGNETDEPVEPRLVPDATYRFDGTTLAVETALLTDRNGTLQLFVKNATVVGENATTTVLNTRIAIGRNLSERAVRQHYRALNRTLSNASTAVDPANATTPDAVVPAPATDAPATATPGANATPAGNATATPANVTATPAGNATETPVENATEAPQVDDLHLQAVTERLAADLPGSVLDTPTRVTADVARVRNATATRTYRNVVLRGTLREVLTGQAATTAPEQNRTAAANATGNDTGIQPPTFDVTNLRAPENATVDGSFNVTATVTNPAAEAATEQVLYRIYGERVVWDRIRLGPGESQNVTFEVDLGPLPLEPGTYEHGVYGFGDSATTRVNLTAAGGTGNGTANGSG